VPAWLCGIFGIQDPSLLAAHHFQDTQYHNKLLQLVSYNMEKAFKRIGHHITVQDLQAFGVPEIMIMAILHYMLVGFANVEVNGRLDLERGGQMQSKPS
jgi:hypothetical protein